ncbi:hypothetical protein C8R43DRAFT_1007695 [Mycena crocata]|nr:hypothetical protein C8R43DRAFT_1007695 [Mycena crocata]
MQDSAGSVAALVHKNIEAWLADYDGNIIPHGKVKVDGETISTSVQMPKDTEYVLRWRNHPGTAHTAFCEVFIPHRANRHFRVAMHFMDKEKIETQERSSHGRLVGAFGRNNGWFQMPAKKKGFVQLEIRRARGTPIHECKPDPKHAGSHLDEIDIDLIDDPAENHAPFIVFRFDLKLGPRLAVKNVPLQSKSTVPQKRKEPESGLQSPPASARSIRAQRSPSPLFSTRGNSEERTILERLNAAKAEEEELDAKLKAQLLATEKRIAAKKELLAK